MTQGILSLCGFGSRYPIFRLVAPNHILFTHLYPKFERLTMSFFPTAPKRPYQITQHGETRVDNYYWMRDRQDPEVMKYLRAESDYLEEVLGHTKPLQDMLYAEMKGRMKEADSSVPEKRGEYYYYTQIEQEKQYPVYCRKKDSLDNAEQILLDQNLLADGKSF